MGLVSFLSLISMVLIGLMICMKEDVYKNTLKYSEMTGHSLGNLLSNASFEVFLPYLRLFCKLVIVKNNKTDIMKGWVEKEEVEGGRRTERPLSPKEEVRRLSKRGEFNKMPRGSLILREAKMRAILCAPLKSGSELLSHARIIAPLHRPKAQEERTHFAKMTCASGRLAHSLSSLPVLLTINKN